ncbi:MAG: hypothetical protein ACXWB9_01680 [Flavisolibacter sp.]
MKNSILLMALAVLFTACKKDVESLPAATQTGANTFGAKLDGDFWIPQKFGVAPTAALLEARYTGTNGIFINARNFSTSPTETEFEIHLKNITGTGVFQLNQQTNKYPQESASYGYFIKRKFMPLNEWITGPQHTGTVNVTRFDTQNHIISGTFSFTAGSMDNTASPISVTEGRFDVKIQ